MQMDKGHLYANFFLFINTAGSESCNWSLSRPSIWNIKNRGGGRLPAFSSRISSTWRQTPPFSPPQNLWSGLIVVPCPPKRSQNVVALKYGRNNAPTSTTEQIRSDHYYYFIIFPGNPAHTQRPIRLCGNWKWRPARKFLLLGGSPCFTRTIEIHLI